MRFSPIFLLALATGPTTALRVGDICGNDYDTGNCQSISWCHSRNGVVGQSGLCPGTGTDIRCCINPDCAAPYQRGYCKAT